MLVLLKDALFQAPRLALMLTPKKLNPNLKIPTGDNENMSFSSIVLSFSTKVNFSFFLSVDNFFAFSGFDLVKLFLASVS